MTAGPDPSEERARRIGLNEAVFRDVNEELTRMSAGLGDGRLDLICECGMADCAGRFRLDRASYEAIRGDSLLFAVLPGHEIPDVEQVVERHGSYNVVRKTAEDARRVVEETDPREPPVS